jgi:hypothetical protein
MSTLRVNSITNLSNQINVGKVITIANYSDYTSVTTGSGSYVTAYTFPNFSKKYNAATSSVSYQPYIGETGSSRGDLNYGGFTPNPILTLTLLEISG